MLQYAENMGALRFSALMAVYAEGNQENGREFWPEEPEAREIALAEQDFCNYLQQVFFKTPGAVYAIWEVDGAYVSAMRLEPYQDGLLLEALETAPGLRRRGYAKALMQAVLAGRENTPIYSHVGKRNVPSQRTHESCGFTRILDYAVYADGSVNQRTYTYKKGP